MIAKKKLPLLLGALCACPLSVLAQTVPSAGQILQQVTPPPRLHAAEAPRTVVDEPVAARVKGGESVRVTGLQFSGNTVFPTPVLQRLLADAIGKQLDLAGLEALADRVTRYYRDRGYLVARAYLPPQDVSRGVVSVTVMEGRLGQVVLDDKAGLAANATAPVQRLHAGEVVNREVFEDSLLRLTDLPGVAVKSTLRPGAAMGSSDFMVDLLPAARWAGEVDADNFGNRYIGAERLGGSLYWNNPAGLGDQLSLRAQASRDDFAYGMLGYQLPVGQSATRIGAAFSAMRYGLGEDFASLDASGRAAIASLYVQQPLLRSRASNWYAALQFDDKQLHDDVGATATRTRKTLRNVTASIYGNFVDTLGGGASNSFSLGYTHGQLDMDAESRQLDRVSANTAGGFGKWSLSYQRNQRLPAGWRLALHANLQWAGKNLDASEKLLLGGAQGVRAYPQGEAGGDSGHVASVELHHAVARGLDAFGFYDRGRVHINQHAWSDADARYRDLAGYGAGLAYALNAFSVQAFAAWKAGTGKPDSDKDRSPRVWAQAVYRF